MYVLWVGLVIGLTQKTGKQRNQGNADEGNTAAGDELFYALGFCTGLR